MGLLGVSSYSNYQFENRDVLKNVARDILSRNNSEEATQKVIDKAFFNTDKQINELYTNQQLSVLKASTQITLNKTLKSTFKYLKEHSKKNTQIKTPVLGELWSIFTTTNDSSEKNPYKGELVDFIIDKNAKNIFVA